MIFENHVMSLSFCFTNLNTAAITWEERNGCAPPAACPFTDPDIEHQMVLRHHRELGVTWSIDGWMQDRSRIRRDTYLEKDRLFLHLGVDLNVEAGTTVNAIMDGTVTYVGNDTPLVGGWGGHVVQTIKFRGRSYALIYAHLDDTFVSRNEKVCRGQRIGLTGNKTRNGFWRPHLHLQLVKGIDYVQSWHTFMTEGIDGYGKLERLRYWAHRCPDPTPLIFI